MAILSQITYFVSYIIIYVLQLLSYTKTKYSQNCHHFVKQLVWNRGEKKDNKNEEILKPVSKTIVPGNEQCQSFPKKTAKSKN